MKKSKLFCKLLSAVSAVAMACSVSFAGAFNTKTIVENCLKNSLYGGELCPEQYDFIKNLGFKDYEEFCELVGPVLGEKFFRNNPCSISVRDDSVQFISFIKLIYTTAADFDKEDLIGVLISQRTKAECREDKDNARMVSAEFGAMVTRFCTLKRL